MFVLGVMSQMCPCCTEAVSEPVIARYNQVDHLLARRFYQNHIRRFDSRVTRFGKSPLPGVTKHEKHQDT